jgi:glycosyltransferase involved in cell wall biosynthesis
VIDDQENGFLVSPTNHLEYANRIIDLLENSKLQTQFGYAARKKVLEKFSIEIIAKQSVDFYTKLFFFKND